MINKVIAYITKGQKLLVFKHSDIPEAGVQVPAGTVEDGEELEKAAIREAVEETGLTGLKLQRFLGYEVIDMQKYGKNEIHMRSYFHLTCQQDTADSWKHEELFPSDGSEQRIFFEFYWVDLDHEVPELAGGQGALLEQLKTSR